MKNAYFVILVGLLVVGCRVRKTETTDTHTRSLDSIASLRSIATSTLEREVVWETVVMRQDSTGNLVIVAKDIKKRTERAAENVQKCDTARFDTQIVESIHHSEEKAAEVAKPRKTAATGFVMGFWLSFALFVAVLAFSLYKSWTLRKS